MSSQQATVAANLKMAILVFVSLHLSAIPSRLDFAPQAYQSPKEKNTTAMQLSIIIGLAFLHTLVIYPRVEYSRLENIQAELIHTKLPEISSSRRILRIGGADIPMVTWDALCRAVY